MTGTRAVSVIIPSYCRKASLERALQAFMQQTMTHSMYEVIVSLDGPDEPTEILLASLEMPYALRVIRQPHSGRATACNAGIRAATGNLLVILDDDMEPTPEFLTAHLDAHQGAERVGILGAVPIALDGATSPTTQYIGRKFNRHLEKLAQPGYEIQFQSFYSGNFSIRRDLLTEVGTFDETFTQYGNEDRELALRLQRAGVELRYCQEALAWQHYEKDFAALARDMREKGQTAVLLTQKHPDTFASLKLSTYQHGNRRWRVLRQLMLGSSQRWDRLPKLVVRFVEWQERRTSANLRRYYELALDYFYWLGVRDARQQGTTADPRVRG